MLHRPAYWVLYFNFLFHLRHSSCLYLHFGRGLSCFLPVRIQYSGNQSCLGSRRGIGILLLLYFGTNTKSGTMLRNLLCGNIGSPLRYMQRIYFRQPDITINATTGVPTRIRLFRIVHPHGNYIFPVPYYIRCKLIAKRDVSIRTFAQRNTVDKHFRIHIYPIKVDIKMFPFLFGICHKALPIPSDAARQSSSSGSRGIMFREVPFYSPIVRKMKPSPLTVVKIERGSVRNFTQMKCPIFVKRESFTRTCFHLVTENQAYHQADETANYYSTVHRDAFYN